MGRISSVGLLVTIVASLLAAQAHGAFPGTNGKIVLATSCQLFVMDPDGTDEQQITFVPCGSSQVPRNPDWSPDGTKIAYNDDTDVFVINADGSSPANITDAVHDIPDTISGRHSLPSWSPDGTKVAFQRTYYDQGYQHEIWVVNGDGTNPVRLETTMCSSRLPTWHPDGTRIAFYAETTPYGTVCTGGPSWWVMNVDGTGVAPLPTEGFFDWSPDGSKVAYTEFGGDTPEVFVQDSDGSSPPTLLTGDPQDDLWPRWSPDGSQILFFKKLPNLVESLHVMNADGSDVTQISTRVGRRASWQPIPVNAYPRPKAAWPQLLPLVPAYEPCTAPNRTHGEPLAFGSCHPPAQTSDQLTVGTPDANGNPAKSVSHVRLAIRRGDPATAADEADVRLHATVTDVRLASDFSDYTGELELRLTVQVTDKDNTPHPGGPGPATVQKFTHAQPLPCAATDGTTVGSSCQLTTTVEALVPGAVKELKRAIWEFDQVEVHDGNGDPFLRQGVFVP